MLKILPWLTFGFWQNARDSVYLSHRHKTCVGFSFCDEWGQHMVSGRWSMNSGGIFNFPCYIASENWGALCSSGGKRDENQRRKLADFPARLARQGWKVRGGWIDGERRCSPPEARSLIQFMKQWMEQINGGHPSKGSLISAELCRPLTLHLSPVLSPFTPLFFLCSSHLLSRLSVSRLLSSSSLSLSTLLCFNAI